MSTPLPPYRPVKRRSGLAVMIASLHALTMRELQTRFGGYRLGYFWAPLEVASQVFIYLLIFGAVMKRTLPGIDYSLFLLSGIVPFYMFQKNATRALGAVSANSGLLMYRAVRHIDIVIARCFLELVIYFFSFCIILFVMWAFFDLTISLAHLDIFLLGWVGLFLFSFGLALIMMIIGHYGGEISKFISILFTILYFVSGVVYSVHIVPEPYLSYLMYNPLIHAIEIMRYALSPTYPTYHIDMGYFAKWLVSINFIGLLLYQFCQKDLIRSK